jgi:hypothetical protein
MARLKDVMREFVSMPDMGGSRTDTPEFARMLSDRLRGILRSNTIYFNVCIGLVLVLFITSIIVVVTNLESPELITAALGGFGIGSVGLVSLMLQRWREKVATEVLLELAVWFQGDHLRMIVNAFHRWLEPSGTAQPRTAAVT